MPFEFSVNGNSVQVEKMEASVEKSVTTSKSFEKYGYYDEHGTLVWNLKVNLNNEKVEENKETISESNSTNTGDKLNYAYVLIFMSAIAGIVF